MPDTPESLLRELAAHLKHDAAVNPKQRPPTGRLVLSEETGSLWKRITNLVGEPSLIKNVVKPRMEERWTVDDMD